MEEVLGILFVIIFVGAILFFCWAVNDYDKKEKEEEPFLVRLIDALSEKSSQAPSVQSPYQEPEWTSSDPTQTAVHPENQAAFCDEAESPSPKTDALNP